MPAALDDLLNELLGEKILHEATTRTTTPTRTTMSWTKTPTHGVTVTNRTFVPTSESETICTEDNTDGRHSHTVAERSWSQSAPNHTAESLSTKTMETYSDGATWGRKHVQSTTRKEKQTHFASNSSFQDERSALYNGLSTSASSARERFATSTSSRSREDSDSHKLSFDEDSFTHRKSTDSFSKLNDCLNSSFQETERRNPYNVQLSPTLAKDARISPILSKDYRTPSSRERVFSPNTTQNEYYHRKANASQTLSGGSYASSKLGFRVDYDNPYKPIDRGYQSDSETWIEQQRSRVVQRRQAKTPDIEVWSRETPKKRSSSVSESAEKSYWVSGLERPPFTTHQTNYTFSIKSSKPPVAVPPVRTPASREAVKRAMIRTRLETTPPPPPRPISPRHYTPPRRSPTPHSIVEEPVLAAEKKPFEEHFELEDEVIENEHISLVPIGVHPLEPDTNSMCTLVTPGGTLLRKAPSYPGSPMTPVSFLTTPRVLQQQSVTSPQVSTFKEEHHHTEQKTEQRVERINGIGETFSEPAAERPGELYSVPSNRHITADTSPRPVKAMATSSPIPVRRTPVTPIQNGNLLFEKNEASLNNSAPPVKRGGWDQVDRQTPVTEPLITPTNKQKAERGVTISDLNASFESTASGMESLPAKLVHDTSASWYKPHLSREEAIQTLKLAPPGSFIVRDSTSFAGAYGLAVKVAQLPPGVTPRPGADAQSELVRHFLIEPTKSGVRLKGCANEPVFPSLTALVHQHALTPLALPCKLLLPELETRPTLLDQGSACNVLYIASLNIESLTGAKAISKAVNQALNGSQPTTTAHLKITNGGVTLTDLERSVFFRRHIKPDQILFAGLDPEGRFWKGSNSTIFGIVARKDKMTNVCHILAQIDEAASSIVSSVCHLISN
ncbi:DgyrCDS1361 [Dimorphilus gyrociliatus]|uniref:DgyrCDS1361 n=1 Tax=Dimorphilus gyrociliatus TaxID=2664684 RepID=A0A7I8VA85_9ANNE|nr:DgyrCDS1361 [Dimorphilus gyrociliatus]